MTLVLNKQADAANGKKTGDGSSVGFFIPLSKELASQFSDLGSEDQSDPHTTFLFVGTVTKERQAEFLAVTSKVLSEIRGPVRGHLYGPDYFVHPHKNRRVAIMRVRFDHDLAGLRWKLRDALTGAGFEVDDYFPLIYSPHATLAYLDGLETEFQGTVPAGDWTFDGIEIWGLPKLTTVEFGNPTRAIARIASKTIDAMHHQVSVDLMKFLSVTAKKLGVSEHVYVVGGAVRNFVIQEPIKDIDVVVDSVSLGGKDSEWFAKQLQKEIPAETNLTTNNYGVAILTVKGDWSVGGHNLAGEVIEIANARTESYSDGGWKPDDVAPSNIKDDTFRREFTFNTLLWRLHDLAEGPDKAEILDLTGCGLKDLQEGTMRCPSDPDKTFADDPSRMIRAIKFLLKYGFKISPEVEASIKRNREKIRNVPPGHLSNMLITLFFDTGVGKKALLEMDKLGLLEVIKSVAQEDKPFREALANWAERKAELSFLFDLMDLGMPTGKSLGFLNPAQKDRVREITVEMGAAEGAAFVAVLDQPGKTIDMPKLIAEFGLKNAEIRTLVVVSRSVLLYDPPLAASGHHWEEAIRKALGKQGKTAAIVEAPHNHHPVKVESPKAKREEHPFEGFIDFQGIEIDVENKEGSTRKGVNEDETPWEVLMHSHYGEIRGTEGTDGDKLDAYVGPNHDSSSVTVVHQLDPDTGEFDEDKVMLGFDSHEEAIGAYKKQYDRPGFYKDGESTTMPIGQFWRWVKDERNHGKKVKTAGVFLGPPAMLKHIEKWMLSAYCGHVLAQVERRLAAVEDTLGPARKGLREMVQQAKDLERNVAQMQPGDILKIQLHLLDTQGRPLNPVIGLRVDKDTYVNREGYPNMWYSHEGKDMTIPEGGQRSFTFGEGKSKLTFPRYAEGRTDEKAIAQIEKTLNSAIGLTASRIQYLDARGESSADSKSRSTEVLQEIKAVCLKYTTKPKMYAVKALREFPVDVTGWKYVKPGSKLIDQVNLQIAERNKWLQEAIQEAEAGLPLAKAYHKAAQARLALLKASGGSGDFESNPEWPEIKARYNSTRDALRDFTQKSRDFYWNSYRIDVEELGEPDGAYVHLTKYDSEWTPVSKVKFESAIGPDEVQRALDKSNWGKITCILDFKGHNTRGGVWRSDARELQVDAKLTDPQSVAEVENGIFWVRRVTRHEVQHVGQDMLQTINKLKENTGLPSKSMRTPGYTPFGQKQFEKGKKWDPKQRDHALRDVEFQTRLADEIDEFVRDINGRYGNPALRKRFEKPPAAWREEAHAWVTGGKPSDSSLGYREFFIKLKAHEPAKWKKAVAEFFKAVEEQLGVAPTDSPMLVASRWVGRLAKTFTINVGDPVLSGKWLNHKGVVTDFGTSDKGDPTVTLQSPTGKKQEVKLFKIREDKSANPPSTDVVLASRVAAKYQTKNAVRHEWTDRYMPSVGETYGWTTMGGEHYQGTVIDTDSNVLEISCTDGTTRMVEAKYQNKKKVKTQDGDDMTVYEYSEKHVENRHKEKAERIDKMRGSIDKLRTQYRKDLKSDDDKVRYTAMAVGLMDETFERVGNDSSAKEGHFGVTGWRKKHVTFSGGKATIKYVGKSGVDHVKEVKDAALVKALKDATKGKGDNDPLCQGEDCRIGAGDVNAYLKPFDISAKDIRGFHANSEMQDRLKAVRSKGGKLPTDKKEREKKLKDEFKTALEETAEAVGHESATLRTQYLVPGLEDEFLQGGKVSESFKKSGMSRTALDINRALLAQFVRKGHTLKALFESGVEHFRLACHYCGGVHQCRCRHESKMSVVGVCDRCLSVLDPATGMPKQASSLAGQLEDKMDALIAAYAEAAPQHPNWLKFQPTEDFEKWFLSKFRINAGLTPRGGKELKDQAQKFLWVVLRAVGQGGGVDGLAWVKRTWAEFKPLVPDLVRLFSEEGTSDVPAEIKTSHATYLNHRGLPRKTLEAYVQSIDKIFASIQGWRKKAMTGDFKVSFAGPDVFRGTASGNYNEEKDIMFLRAIPAIMKRTPGKYASPDYIIVHELGHRYERKVGVRFDFDKSEWFTTRYSRTESFGGSESFAELFALGHFGMNTTAGGDYTAILAKFEDVMTGQTRMARVATKTHGEKEDEESERLVRPAPPKKPPRHDLHDEQIHEKDPDLDQTDEDLSLNYKKVAYLWVMGANKRQKKKNEKKKLQQQKPSTPPKSDKPQAPKPDGPPPLPKKPDGPPPLPKSEGPPPLPSSSKKKEPEHKPGEVWKTDDGFAANNPDGVMHAFEKEDAAKAYAKGQSLDDMSTAKPQKKEPEKTKGQAAAKEHKTQIEGLAKALEGGKPAEISKATKSLEALYSKNPALAKHKPALDKFVADIKQSESDLAKASISLEMSTTNKDKKEFKGKQEKALKVHDDALAGIRELGNATVEEEPEPAEEEPAKDGTPSDTPPKTDSGDDPTQPVKLPAQTVAEKHLRKQMKKVDEAVEEHSKTTPAVKEHWDSLTPEERLQVSEDMKAETEKLEKKYRDDPQMATLEIGDSVHALDGNTTKQLGKQLAKAEYVHNVLANPFEFDGVSLDESNAERTPEQLVEAGKASFKKFVGMTPEIRGIAAKKLAAALKDTPEGHKRDELLRVADGMYMAAIIDGKGDEMIVDGEPLGGPIPAPSFVAMARALHKTGKADILMGTKADFYGPEGREYVKQAMADISDEDLMDVVGAGADMREAFSDPKVSKAAKGVLRKFLQDQAANDMTVSHHIITSQIKDSDAIKEAWDRVNDAVDKDTDVRKALKEHGVCLAAATKDAPAATEDKVNPAIQDCENTKGKALAIARAKAQLAAILKEVPNVSPNHPQLRQLQRVIETKDPSEMKNLYMPTPLSPEVKKQLDALHKDDRSAIAQFQAAQEDAADDDWDDVSMELKKPPKSNADLMRDFLAHAKPETIERMKSMSPDDFVKLMGALMGDENPDAAPTGKFAGVFRRRLTWFL